MSGLSVALRCGLSVLAALAIALPVVSHAQVRVIIRQASQLADDKEVSGLMQLYSLASGTNVLYVQCGDALGITQAQKDFLAQHFAQLSQATMQSFHNAFKARTGGVSTKELADSYYAYMVAVQQEAATRTATLIAQKGCGHNSFPRMIEYYEQLKNTDAAGASQPATPTLQ
jgi:hypothetical protein